MKLSKVLISQLKIYIRNAFTNMIVKTSRPVSYHAVTIIYDF